MKNLIILLLLFITPLACWAQRESGMVRIPPKPFTLRNAKVTPGLYASFHRDETADISKGFQKYDSGNLPGSFALDFGKGDTLHYLTAGLMLDISSPNSVIGFVLGVEYNLNKFSLRETLTDTLNSFQIHTIRLPAYLKLKIGDIHNRINGILMGGAQLALPVGYQRRLDNGMKVKNMEEILSGIYLSGLVGLQYRTARQGGSRETSERTRFWVFGRVDLATNSLFSASGSNTIFGSQNSRQASFEDINISLGLAFFLGAGGK